MRKEQLKAFDEFELTKPVLNGDDKTYTITTDLGSAKYDDGDIIIEGTARRKDEKLQVTVTVHPVEDSSPSNRTEFNESDFSFEVLLNEIQVVESGRYIEKLYV